MFNFFNLYHWIDLLWIPILFFGVHKQHRWYSAGFAVGSVILVHTLSEIMNTIGYSQGIIGYLSSNVHARLLIVSSAIYAFYLLTAHFSSKTEGVVFMAACLSFFFMILVAGSISMIL